MLGPCRVSDYIDVDETTTTHDAYCGVPLSEHLRQGARRSSRVAGEALPGAGTRARRYGARGHVLHKRREARKASTPSTSCSATAAWRSSPRRFPGIDTTEAGK